VPGMLASVSEMKPCTNERPVSSSSSPCSIRQHTPAYVSIRQHTSAYVSIRQHTSAYVSIRQHTSASPPRPLPALRPHVSGHIYNSMIYVCMYTYVYTQTQTHRHKPTNTP
jgi:hypothetical protein